MVFSKVKNIVKDEMISLGFSWWSDSFNFENVPSTLIDKSFHIDLDGEVRQEEKDPRGSVFALPYKISFVIKGFRDVDQGHSLALDSGEKIIKHFLSSQNELKEKGIININLDQGLVLSAKNPSNDNLILGELTLLLRVMLCY